MYTVQNFRTKKAIKDLVKAGRAVEVYDNSMFATGVLPNGAVCLEGPHAPAPHTWYAQAIVKDGIIVSIK